MLGTCLILHATDAILGARFAVSLASCLALGGRRVLLLDCNGAVPALDILLGVDGRVVYTVSDVGRISPYDAVLSVGENLMLLPIGVGETVDSDRIRLCVDALQPDVVLLSAARESFAAVRECADRALLLTDASPVAVRAASTLAVSGGFDGFVLTDFVAVREEIVGTLGLTALMDTLSLPLFGILPRTERYSTHTVWERDFSVAVKNMAERLTGGQVPLLRGIPIEGMRKKHFFTRISE